LVFMVRVKIYNFTEVLETAAIYKAAVFEYNDKKGNTIDGE
jgi:hypothetical protein